MAYDITVKYKMYTENVKLVQRGNMFALQHEQNVWII